MTTAPEVDFDLLRALRFPLNGFPTLEASKRKKPQLNSDQLVPSSRVQSAGWERYSVLADPRLVRRSDGYVYRYIPLFKFISLQIAM